MKRNISGILLLDKPINFTSNEALQTVKKLFKAKKAGHTGSLDPIATGMLPICLGEATKFSQFLLESDKHYLVTGKLGETTASGDKETPVIEKRKVEKINPQNFEMILANFRGKISQIPPMYSAIKHQGQPLYKLVRQGIEVTRSAREITIYKLQLLEIDNDLVKFDIYCSKGTYVRTLIADIGEALGCGAHVIALRRLAVGPYQSTPMVSLKTLQELAIANNHEQLDRFLLPIETVLSEMTEVVLTNDMIHYAFLGQSILVTKKPKEGWVKLKSKEGKFLGIGEITPDGKITPRKMVELKSIYA